MERSVERTEPRGFDLTDDAEGLGEAGLREVMGRMAGEELVKDEAECVDVGPGVDRRRVAGNLLDKSCRTG